MIVQPSELDAWLSPLFTRQRDIHLTFDSFDLEGLYENKYLYKITTNEGPTYHYERHSSDVFLNYVEGSFHPGDLAHQMSASDLEYFLNSSPPPLPIQLEREMWRRSWYFDMLRLFRLTPELIDILELPSTTWILPIPILNAFAVNEKTMHYMVAHINGETHTTLVNAESKLGQLFGKDDNFPHGLEYVNYQIQRSTVDTDLSDWSVMLGALRVPKGEPDTPEYNYNDHSWTTKASTYGVDRESPWWKDSEAAWTAFTMDPKRHAIYTALSYITQICAIATDHELRGTSLSEVDCLATASALQKIQQDGTLASIPKDLAEKHINEPLAEAGISFQDLVKSAPNDRLAIATDLVPDLRLHKRPPRNRRQRRRR